MMNYEPIGTGASLVEMRWMWGDQLTSQLRSIDSEVKCTRMIFKSNKTPCAKNILFKRKEVKAAVINIKRFLGFFFFDSR